MKQLTEMQIAEKAFDLGKKNDCKVTPIVIDADGEQVIGYFLEPSTPVVLFALDAYFAGNLSEIAEAILKDCLIQEESDARIMSDARKHSRIKFSFANKCLALITPYVEANKKKDSIIEKRSTVVSMKKLKP